MGCDGFNPLRWNCEERGCFNKKQRPKIELFADALPGKCAFGDVDAITELKGRALSLEWKSDPMPIGMGQRIMWSNLSRGSMLTTLCVAGNAETMEVTHKGLFYNGHWHGWEKADFDAVHEQIKNWGTWALANPMRAP